VRGEERGGGKRGGHAEGAGETRVEERWEVKERREEKERREGKGEGPSSWYPLLHVDAAASSLLLGAGGVFLARDSFFSDCFL